MLRPLLVGLSLCLVKACADPPFTGVRGEGGTGGEPIAGGPSGGAAGLGGSPVDGGSSGHASTAGEGGSIAGAAGATTGRGGAGVSGESTQPEAGSAGEGGQGGQGGADSDGEAGAAGAPFIDPSEMQWVGTWATAPQLTEPNNLPPLPTVLSDNTLRQVVYVSIAGTELRVQFSNAFSSSPLTINGANIAIPVSGSAIQANTVVNLTFGRKASVTIPGGQEVFSDVVRFPLAANSKVAVTTYFGAMSNHFVTGHPGSRTTSFIAKGNALKDATFSAPVATDHWYILTGIDVNAPDSPGAVVTLGDSITDGRGSTTNGNDRWPDVLSRRLRAEATTAKIGVLNMGIGGNRLVLPNGLGPSARERFDRDVLGQRGVRWVIVLEGVNDIGAATNQQVAQQMIDTYEEFIEKAHSKGLLIYGVPILPFGGSGYDTPDHQAIRTTVNNWMRASGLFDAVIDMDAAVRDPSNPTRLLPTYDTGDHLHLNQTGLKAMANAIDLSLFAE